MRPPPILRNMVEGGLSSDPTDLTGRVYAALDHLAGDQPALAVALSGGGDSAALLHLAAGWAGARRLFAVTVDHRLRPDSGAEALAAGRMAAGLGVPHHILDWQHAQWPPGNLMAEARQARMQLISTWAQAQGIGAILLGHTRDDQAETLMMRLERGAGIDGLAAMAARRQAADMLWLRPLLHAGRAELRSWLVRQNIEWIDDPSNENADFDRIRMRRTIETARLPVAGLALSAANLADARDALAHYAAQAVAGAHARGGSLFLPRAGFDDSPLEIRRRIVIAMARWISGAEYPPRRASVMHVLEALEQGRRGNLQGALFHPDGAEIRAIREPAQAQRAEPGGAIWDDRWHIGGLEPGQHVSALGFDALEGLDWRGAGLNRDEAAASPAIRLGNCLIGAPLIRPLPGISARPLREIGHFRQLIAGQ